MSAILRQSNRLRHNPTYLQNYICNLSTKNTQSTSHWCNLISASKIPAPILATDVSEPRSYEAAASHPLWNSAIQKEDENQTWDLLPLPQGKKPIGCKWVYKVKAISSLERCKARLVAKGFNQKHGVKYDEIFSPVVKMSTVRNIISLAASKH